MKVLVTGSAGFIGSSLTMYLLERGDKVEGIDNHNDYYDPSLKEARVNRFIDHPNYTHIRMDIRDRDIVDSLFKKKNSFKGKIGVFDVENNQINHRLNFYKINDGKFIKIF